MCLSCWADSIQIKAWQLWVSCGESRPGPTQPRPLTFSCYFYMRLMSAILQAWALTRKLWNKFIFLPEHWKGNVNNYIIIIMYDWVCIFISKSGIINKICCLKFYIHNTQIFIYKEKRGKEDVLPSDSFSHVLAPARAGKEMFVSI